MLYKCLLQSLFVTACISYSILIFYIICYQYFFDQFLDHLVNDSI